MKNKIKLILKTIILSACGAFLISLIEQSYYEEMFYQPATRQLDFNKYFPGRNPSNSLNLICPTNFEARIFHLLTSDHTKSDPTFNPWNLVKGTKYEQFPEEFVNIDNEKEVQEKIRDINERIEVCDFLINSTAKFRILTLTTYSALQPLHLVLGWILSKILLKIGKVFALLLRSCFPNSIPLCLKRLGYFFRGIGRRIAKIFKDYEDLGK